MTEHLAFLGAAKIGFLALIALGLTDVKSAFALATPLIGDSALRAAQDVSANAIPIRSSPGSGQRHQVSETCRALLDAKGLKGDARKTEYQKCKLDPINYK
jgi:hypothetical protein